jgi:hypothetical protein
MRIARRYVIIMGMLEGPLIHPRRLRVHSPRLRSSAPPTPSSPYVVRASAPTPSLRRQPGQIDGVAIPAIPVIGLRTTICLYAVIT